MIHIYAGMTIYRIIHLILKVKPNPNRVSLDIFRQVAITLYLDKPVIVPISTVVLCSLFLLLVASVNAIIIGIFIGQAHLMLTGIIVANASFQSVVVVFFICCHIFEDSSALLHYWISTITKDTGYTRRVLKGTRVLSVPAGTVGIFDKDIQMNYFVKVISYVADVRIICKELFLHY